MDVEAAEFRDWEMLNSNRASDSEPLAPAGNTNGVDDVGPETGGLIQPNYFCIDSQIRYMSTFPGAGGNEEDSEESDNPSWIDPGSENQFTMKTSGEFWSDSGSERSETQKIGEFEGKSELGFEGIEEITSENGKNLEEFMTGSVKFGDFEENNRFAAGQNSHLQDGSVEEKQENGNVEGEKKIEVEKRNAGDEKRSIVWWKVPIELVKCCAFRVSPVWTFSLAAAVMAFVILGRRLYKMKKKPKALELKVTVDDKNVSQFTSHAARLNQAFSIVKRVPVIRPQLPAAGVTMWPVVSLR